MHEVKFVKDTEPHIDLHITDQLDCLYVSEIREVREITGGYCVVSSKSHPCGVAVKESLAEIQELIAKAKAETEAQQASN